VILRKVDGYDSAVIQDVIAEGIQEFGIEERVKGKITIKPNVVMAHHKLAPSAFTRVEFLDGLIGAVSNLSGRNAEISLAEKTGFGLPTSRMFRRAGYGRLKKKHGIRLIALEEERNETKQRFEPRADGLPQVEHRHPQGQGTDGESQL